MVLKDLFEIIEPMIKDVDLICEELFKIDHSLMNQKQNLRPREMMLKNPQIIQNQLIQNDKSSNFFAQPKVENHSLGDFVSSTLKSQTIIKNFDGTEKIVSKSVQNGRTIEKEIIKRGNQIISEREISSDIEGLHSSNNSSWSFRFW